MPPARTHYRQAVDLMEEMSIDGFATNHNTDAKVHALLAIADALALQTKATDRLAQLLQAVIVKGPGDDHALNIYRVVD